MIVLLRITWGIMIIVMGFCLLWIAYIFVHQWGMHFEHWDVGMRPYLTPLMIGINGTTLYYATNSYLKQLENRFKGQFVVVFTLPEGMTVVEMEENKDGSQSIRVWDDLKKLLEAFRVIHTTALEVDYETFVTTPYMFNIMRPHIVEIPKGENITWVESFRTNDSLVEVSLPPADYKSNYLPVNADLLEHTLIDIVQKFKEEVYSKKSKQNS